MDNIEKLLQQGSSGDPFKRTGLNSNKFGNESSIKNSTYVTKVTAPPPAPKPIKKNSTANLPNNNHETNETTHNGEVPNQSEPELPILHKKIEENISYTESSAPTEATLPPPPTEEFPAPPVNDSGVTDDLPPPASPLSQQVEELLNLETDDSAIQKESNPETNDEIANTSLPFEQSEPVPDLPQEKVPDVEKSENETKEVSKSNALSLPKVSSILLSLFVISCCFFFIFFYHKARLQQSMAFVLITRGWFILEEEKNTLILKTGFFFTFSRPYLHY